MLGVGLSQGEAPGVLQLLVRGPQRFDQRHERDAGLADVDLEHALPAGRAGAVGVAGAWSTNGCLNAATCSSRRGAIPLNKLRVNSKPTVNSRLEIDRPNRMFVLLSCLFFDGQH